MQRQRRSDAGGAAGGDGQHGPRPAAGIRPGRGPGRVHGEYEQRRCPSRCSNKQTTVLPYLSLGLTGGLLDGSRSCRRRRSTPTSRTCAASSTRACTAPSARSATIRRPRSRRWSPAATCTTQSACARGGRGPRAADEIGAKRHKIIEEWLLNAPAHACATRLAFRVHVHVLVRAQPMRHK